MGCSDSVGDHRHLIFKLRALRAPMYDAKTGKKCRELCLSPGRIYTFGRSRSSCDVIFLDGRVSRQHCQVYLDPVAKQIYLLEGAAVATNEDLRTVGQDLSVLDLERSKYNFGEQRGSVNAIQLTTTSSSFKVLEHQNHVCKGQFGRVKISAEEKVRRFGTPVENIAEGSGGGPALLKSESAAVGIVFGEQARNAKLSSAKDENKDSTLDKLVNNPLCSCGRSLIVVPPKKRASLNGLYVNGEKLAHGGHRILNPGSEVSLIACTKEGQPVDPGFGEAVGFVVEVECSKRNSSVSFHSAEVDMDGPFLPNYDNSCISRLPSISCRKRPLANMSDKQCGYDTANVSRAQVPVCREGTPLQPVSLARLALLKGQEKTGCKIGKTGSRRVHDQSGKVDDTFGQGANFLLKQTPPLPKNKLNKGGREQKRIGRLKKSQRLRLQPGRDEILPKSLNNAGAGLEATVSFASTELPVSEISILTGQSKPASKLSQKQLSDSTCRFLSASDCTRKLSASRADNTATNSHTTLTDAIEVIVGESFGGEVLEQQGPHKVWGQEDVAKGMCRTEPKSDEDIMEEILRDESHKAVLSRKQEMQKAAENNLGPVGRRKSYSASPILGKIPKRSTGEIMGLLRQVAPAPTNIETLDESDKILSGPVRNLQLSGQCAAKFSSGADLKFQGNEMLEGKSSGSRRTDGKAVRLALERSLTKSSNSVHVVDQAFSRCEVEHLGTSKELGRNLMGSVQNSTPIDEGEGLNGRCTRSGFLLNRLKDLEHSRVHSEESVSLQDLLTPTDDLLGLFVATFTSDIPWFLSSHSLSPDLPVTIACHEYDRCWSKAEESRSSSPFPAWPNVTVVYPPFPDSCCFATEKRQGIGCHHPKIFLLPRQKSMRVIVTSANLTRTQWLHVTNNVWWQDFPRKDSCDYEALFCMTGADRTGSISNHIQSDFAVHLSSFVASLVADVPSAAHWALDLAEYDFSSATASLVTSIPGLHGCPCPPVPRSISDVVKGDIVVAENGVQQSRKFLAAVNSNVVGVSHSFKGAADPSGKRVRALAAVLNATYLHEGGMLAVQLKRVTNVAADPNAVSVIVSSEASQRSKGMIIGKDLLQMTSDSPSSTPCGSVHIGFLPRTVAKWVAPLYDSGVCTFGACIWPNEVLGLASGLSKKVVQLVLYVFEGWSFSLLSSNGLSMDHKVALSCLLRNMERPLGLWRLHQVLSKFNWLDSAETNFVFGSSSVGTSLDAAFLASFAAAAGKKAPSSDLSSESDSEWGAWTAEHEANSPSIGVIFPTIERIKSAKGGPCTHQGILCFAESTWERLKTARLLHDAVPFPAEREGFPMHVKVAQRRFQNSSVEPSYGWIYCGSHNFSPAAWGRTLAKTVHPCTCPRTALGCALFICNYEVGLIFVEPPPSHSSSKLKFKPLIMKPNLDEGIKEMHRNGKRSGLDAFVLPFRVPAPKYEDVDRPATGRAIHSAVVSWRIEQMLAESSLSEDDDVEMENSEADDSMDEIQACLESEAADFELSADMQMEELYGETLWSQIDTVMPL